MNRLVLLSVIALLLVSAVFAPVAMAQTAGEVNVQEVSLGQGGSLILSVSGTIQCTEGRFYYVSVSVWQRTVGNTINYANNQASGWCEASGPQPFTITMFGERPFHRGPAEVSWFGGIMDEPFYCDPNTCDTSEGTKDVFIR